MQNGRLPAHACCWQPPASGFTSRTGFLGRHHFLARGQYHDHLPTFQFGHRLNLGQIGQIVTHALEHAHAEFLVSHFATTEAKRNFGFVTVIQETLQITQLDLVITLVGSRAEFDFLDLNDLLLRPGFRLAFLLLVLELTVVHQAADGRLGIRCDFDQIEIVLFRQAERIGDLDDAQLFSLCANQADFRDADLTVDTVGFFSGDVDNS